MSYSPLRRSVPITDTASSNANAAPADSPTESTKPCYCTSSPNRNQPNTPAAAAA
ncbi:hypothetical protein GA0070615_3590 [Micromonospora aurantiaca]|nr:hypothetical protein GA0070615_3590 [Micromonospora aurantiaca]